VTDDLSGLDFFAVSWIHEQGHNSGRNCQFQLQAEGHRDVQVQCLLEFPRYSASGRWLVNSIETGDHVGNRGGVWPLVFDGDSGRYEYKPDAPDLVKGMEITIGAAATQPPAAAPALFLPAVRR
jgi:hypothetical protein